VRTIGLGRLGAHPLLMSYLNQQIDHCDTPLGQSPFRVRCWAEAHFSRIQGRIRPTVNFDRLPPTLRFCTSRVDLNAARAHVNHIDSFAAFLPSRSRKIVARANRPQDHVAVAFAQPAQGREAVKGLVIDDEPGVAGTVGLSGPSVGAGRQGLAFVPCLF